VVFIFGLELRGVANELVSEAGSYLSFEHLIDRWLNNKSLQSSDFSYLVSQSVIVVVCNKFYFSAVAKICS